MVTIGTIKLTCANCHDCNYYDVVIEEAKPKAVELQGREREGQDL